jgi:MscS family membrane protein
MPGMDANDTNLTVALDTLGNIDRDLWMRIQAWLSSVYEAYPIMSETLFGIPLANLLAAIAVFLFFLLLRHIFTSVVMVIVQGLAHKSKTHYDDRVISALKGPLGFAFVLIGIHLFALLILSETPTIKKILDSLVVYTIFWAILALCEALKGLVYDFTAKFNKDLSKEIGNFFLTILKVLIFAMGLAAILQVWGINVTALVASLGIGGLAFALAAKDTIANLFGSFSLLADRTVRIGEWVKVGTVEGVIEDIGMRTTKIRSFDKSIITVPNHVLADNPIENFSRRGVRRIKMAVGVTYGTTGQQMRGIVQDIREMLASHEGIAHDETLLVNFESFGESSLNLFIYTFTNTANWANYMQIREDVHLRIMEIVESHGSSFAFPSQSLYIESLPPVEPQQA